MTIHFIKQRYILGKIEKKVLKLGAIVWQTEQMQYFNTNKLQDKIVEKNLKQKIK